MPPASSRPLSDREIGELDGILAAIPDEGDPLDVVMLDGFLIGVLLQPEAILPSDWLPLVFDADGRDISLPGDAAQATRAIELIMRRYNELAACIAAREPFDPIVFELDDERGEPLAGREVPPEDACGVLPPKGAPALGRPCGGGHGPSPARAVSCSAWNSCDSAFTISSSSPSMMASILYSVRLIR
jgi:uncharacterized protein